MSRINEFNLPDLGEGLTEGEILKWLVAVGDMVELNQPIVEVETAKAAVEIPAKWAGRVESIFHGEGETVEVGTPIIAIDTQPDTPRQPGSEPAGAPSGASAPSAVAASEAAGAPAELDSAGSGRTAVLVGYGPRTAVAKRRPRPGLRPNRPEAGPQTGPGADTPSQTPPTAGQEAAAKAVGAEVTQAGAAAGEAAETRTTEAGAGQAGAADAGGVMAGVAAGAAGAGVAEQQVLAKPPVRKLARDLGVDLHTLSGTGPQGSITREDVQAASGTVPQSVEVAATAATGPGLASATRAIPAARSAPAAATAPAFGPDREWRIPIKGVRKLTAENMVASAFTAPHVTEFLTVDVTRSMRALERLRQLPQWRDVRISPLLLVAKAALLAIGRHPLVNSTWSAQTGEIVVKEYVNLGIAAATERGLIVPNIKDAGRLSLRELADAMTELVQVAKAGKTPPPDMSGGTFTITNVGIFGVDSGTPILPPGEAAILALGAVREAPWVHKGKVKVRQVTTLGVSFDHRIIDGELGSKFLHDLGQFLTDPEAALLAWC